MSGLEPEIFPNAGSLRSSEREVYHFWTGTNSTHVLARTGRTYLMPRPTRQAPEGKTACYIFLDLSPAVGFSYVMIWALLSFQTWLCPSEPKTLEPSI